MSTWTLSIVWHVVVLGAQTLTLTIGMFAALLIVFAATTTATWLLASVAGVLDTGAPAASVVVPVLLVLPVVVLLVLLVLLVVLVGVPLDPPPPPQPATSATAAAKPNAPSARANLL
ncbi:hypothetical protein [Paraburkholderia sp. NMBU_R16]|uniref:hypothetical protein n=1 Tax=Paraburkholderia sp. NMBU_R16 TaxID=2698676 RepID=UPI00349F1A36